MSNIFIAFKTKLTVDKAYGVRRLAYNYGVEMWHKNLGYSIKDIRNIFNKDKYTEYPFVQEVTSQASQMAFLDLEHSIKMFYSGIQGKPGFCKKSLENGSFSIDGQFSLLYNSKTDTDYLETKVNPRYFKIPRLGKYKLAESIPYKEYRICRTDILRECYNKYYISFSLEIPEAEYNRTHKQYKKTYKSVGIDLGIKSLLTLSNGLQIENPKILDKFSRAIKRKQRQLERKQHPRTKGDSTIRSNNYIKAAAKLAKIHSKVKNCRKDYLHKVTTVLTTFYNNIYIEDLKVQNMQKNHYIARSLQDVSFYAIRSQLQYKAKMKDINVHVRDTFYPSSKACNNCGTVKKQLGLGVRIFKCNECGYTIDRDLNAAKNILGQALPKVTPVEIIELQKHFKRNGIVTYIVEPGKIVNLERVVGNSGLVRNMYK